MAIRNKSINSNNLVKLYLSGESIKALGERFKVSRQVIYRILRETNTPIRNRSEAMYNRMKNTSIEERKAITQKSNIARKSKKVSEIELINKALAAEKNPFKSGEFEIDFLNKIKEHGFNPTLQKAFYKYNFDIGVGNVAVEIHQTTRNPLTFKYTLDRIMDLNHRGINCIYIWINPRNKIVSNLAYDEVIRFIQLAESNPTFVGKYRVIRGTGEFYTAGSFNSN